MADGIATLISSLGLTQETFLVFCVLAILVVGAVVVIITSRPILDIYPYLNPSARVRARKGSWSEQTADREANWHYKVRILDQNAQTGYADDYQG
jgi:membrane carboxypeptidase/penicillin-binding protein PbpC